MSSCACAEVTESPHGSGQAFIGVIDDAQRKLSASKYELGKSEGVLYYSSGRITNSTGKSGSGEPYGTGDTVRVSLDFEAKTITFTLNGRPSGAPVALKSTSYAPGKAAC